MAPEQAAVEAGDLVGGDAHPLARRHAGGHAVDGVSALDRPLDDAARLAHALDGVGRDLDGLVRPRSAYDLVDREVEPREEDRHAQTSAAVSAIARSFARSSSSVRSFPSTEVAKPHCGESASRSSGQNALASSIRSASSPTVSRRPLFVVTSPRTAILPSGTEASGSKRARPLVVVLEQQPLRVDPREEPLGEPVVAALDEPAARLVPAAEVEAERDPVVLADDEVVELEPELEPALGRPPAARVEVAVARIEEQRVVRRVELDVGGAEANELVDLLAQDLGDVAEELLQASGRRPSSARGPRSSRTGSGSEA